jgi:pSer/pThr/pTyr-binding forkhead associated (FHA) protein
MDAKAYLIMAGPPQTAWVYPITDERIVFGRDGDCQVRLVHPTVSRRHCEVWAEEEKLLVRDLKSLNGTYVNGVAVRQRRLAFGDLLQVGPLVVQVVQALQAGAKVFDIGADDDETPDVGEPAQTNTLASFTAVEQSIVKLLAEGHSEKEVAARLKLNRHSVHSTVKQLYKRLGVSSRAELLVWYWRGSPGEKT